MLDPEVVIKLGGVGSPPIDDLDVLCSVNLGEGSDVILGLGDSVGVPNIEGVLRVQCCATSMNLRGFSGLP